MLLSIREISKQDYYHGYMDVINAFTRNMREVTHEDFCEKLDDIKNQGGIIIVAVDDSNGSIVGTAKVLIESKMHNNLGRMGHIEDVAVHPDMRRKNIGRLLISKCTQICDDNSCYKIVLSCKPDLQIFYEQTGFVQTGIAMTRYKEDERF